MTPRQLAGLLQLSSPSLPVGGYSYSQGLESAIELGIVTDEASAGRWIGGQLEHVVGQCEAPLWSALYRAWAANDAGALQRLNACFLATRETHELLQETRQMGWSLLQLAQTLNWCPPDALALMRSMESASLPCVHAACVTALEIDHDAGMTAYLFTWLENQVMAAMKAVPLGQVAGQRLLHELGTRLQDIGRLAQEAAAHDPPRLRTFAPHYAIVAARHETQYSRLFRS